MRQKLRISPHTRELFASSTDRRSACVPMNGTSVYARACHRRQRCLPLGRAWPWECDSPLGCRCAPTTMNNSVSRNTNIAVSLSHIHHTLNTHCVTTLVRWMHVTRCISLECSLAPPWAATTVRLATAARAPGPWWRSRRHGSRRSARAFGAVTSSSPWLPRVRTHDIHRSVAPPYSLRPRFCE